MKIRGLRVDPSRLGDHYHSPDEAVDGLIADATANGVDHLFVLAFHPSLGAFYPSKAMDARVEPVFGAGGFLPKLVFKASQAGVKVVAAFNLNRFDDRAALHPDMRVKTVKMLNYEPPMISAYASGFRSWLKTLVDDCAIQHPDLAGMEAYMTGVALKMETARDEMPDYHREATRLFLAKWPKEPLGGAKWRDYRSNGIANLHKTLFDAARLLKNGRSFVCQELPTVAPCDTNLMSFADYGRLSGFAWDKAETLGMNAAVLDASWQRREAACGQGVFHPAWVLKAWAQFSSYLDAVGGTDVIAQVDSTPYRTVTGAVLAPTADQFRESLARAIEAPGGAVAGEYCALKAGGLLESVGAVYRS